MHEQTTADLGCHLLIHNGAGLGLVFGHARYERRVYGIVFPANVYIKVTLCLLMPKIKCWAALRYVLS